MGKYKFFEEDLPINVNKEQETKVDNNKEDAVFEARYRCEQLNVTKVEDNVSFHCNTKKQYLLQYEKSDLAKVVLEQFIYKINPESLKDAIIATEPLEYSKENVLFSLSKDNKIEKVLNFEEIKKKWDNYKPELMKTAFYKSILEHDFKAAEDFIKGGDIEFGTEKNLIKTYEKVFFFHVLFNDYDPWLKRKDKQRLGFTSQIFINIPIELELTHGIIEENSDTVEIMTVGRLVKDKLDNKILEDQYNKLYRPMIEYDFSEYNYEYVISRIIDKKTATIISAKANLKEEIKYNYQFITQFDLKKID